MIGEVFADMAYFMLVFFVLIIAWSDAFYSESNSIQEPYLDDFFHALRFSYITAIGDFDTDGFTGFVPWLLFFVSSVFNLIVLLNLLIAIISDTYDRVNNTKD